MTGWTSGLGKNCCTDPSGLCPEQMEEEEPNGNQLTKVHQQKLPLNGSSSLQLHTKISLAVTGLASCLPEVYNRTFGES